ncbi:hypothetical protein [Ramlibacter sp. WS9]|nr:hypothetical protein [Ramlibacter sp. WS9]
MKKITAGSRRARLDLLQQVHTSIAIDTIKVVSLDLGGKSANII